jgi:transposase InsO family protein
LIISEEEDDEREFVVASLIAALEAEDESVLEIRRHGETDPEYKAIQEAIRDGWPTKQEVAERKPELSGYFRHRDRLMTGEDGIVLFGKRALIPAALRRVTLRRLHASHQGVAKTCARARETVWWPGIEAAIEDTVKRCATCRERLPSQAAEPLEEEARATRPFQRWHADLGKIGSQNYLVLVDEYTGWPSVHIMGKDTTASAVVTALANTFSSFGFPEAFKSDNGLQFVAEETRKALAEWNVRAETSAPHLSRTNGRAEAAVKAIKKLLVGITKEGNVQPDPKLLAEGLVALRNTGIEGGPSPAVLAFGRPLREPLLRPCMEKVPEEEIERRQQKAADTRTEGRERYDKCTRPLKPLTVGQPVWVQDPETGFWDIEGVVQEARPHHEYLVGKGRGRDTVVRARVHLRERLPDPVETKEGPKEMIPTAKPRRSGRAPKPKRPFDM